MFIYLFLRESTHTRRERAEKERKNPNRLRGVNAEANMGLNLMNREILTWAEIQSQTLNQLSHLGASWLIFQKQKQQQKQKSSNKRKNKAYPQAVDLK